MQEALAFDILRNMTYLPNQKVFENYAKVLINFALGGGKGIKKGDVVYLAVPECAKPFLVALRREVLLSGGHPMIKYIPDRMDREHFELANDEQISFFPRKYLKARVDLVDHSVGIIAETDKHELEGIDPAKIMLSSKSMKPYKKWRDEKENKGKFTWTLALYGTKAMADEVGLTEKDYWEQIIKACYLDEADPVAKWKKIFAEIERVRARLNDLKIEKLKVEAKDTDLEVLIGPHREWLGGSGRNIPSFEIFTSPDWRGTNGKISFNQPLYRYGSLIEGVKLEFKSGKVTKATATKNEKLLLEMIKQKNADKIGEFSLTDGRRSRITKFMGETLYDENAGGRYGNTHIALGSSYKDAYPGNPGKVKKENWEKWGYNDSIIHTDIISTENRTVTATLPSGSTKVIYKDGKFII